MQRGKWGEIPESVSPHPRVGQGDLSAGKRLQDARARGPLRRTAVRALIKACDGGLRLLQSTPHLSFQQGQQPQRQGQESRQPCDLLRLPDKQRAEAQGEAFDEMEIPFQRPATPALIMASATPFRFCTTQKHITVKRAMSSRG